MIAVFGVGQVLWSIMWFFLFFVWIMLLLQVFGDIFRSEDLGGVAKFLWVLFVIVTPYLGAFVYLIVRGGKMADRQVRAVQAGWGVSVLPELQVRELLAQGALVNLAPQTRLSINLYWHCWNLDSVVIDRLTVALSSTAREVLRASKPAPELAHQ